MVSNKHLWIWELNQEAVKFNVEFKTSIKQFEWKVIKFMWELIQEKQP